MTLSSRFQRLLKASLALMAGPLLNAAVNAEKRPKTSPDFEFSDGRPFIRLSKLPPGLTVLQAALNRCVAKKESHEL